MDKVQIKNIKKEKEEEPPVTPTTKKRVEEPKKSTSSAKSAPSKTSKTSASSVSSSKTSTASSSKKAAVEAKVVKKEKEEEDLKGLEEMYYGIQDGYDEYYEIFPYKPEKKDEDPGVVYPKSVECPICDTATTFDSNDKLQKHLVSHIIIEGKDTKHQCVYCLEKHNSETQLNKHYSLMHPKETKSSNSPSFRCLLCQQRFNSLNFLTSHLQNKHSLLELPYCCQACGYRSSSHRDIVMHFYEGHKHQNILQCPYCLDIYRFSYKGKLSQSNIENFYMHLRQHLGKRDTQLKCQKCALTFIDKGSLKQHSSNHHSSLSKNSQNIRQLLRNSMLVPPPKVRSHHREPLPFTTQSKFGEFYAFIDGSICAECNSEIINEGHFTGVLKCNKCNYKTCCERAMFQHGTDCNGAGSKDVMELPLANEMHCICGFSTANGNKMAHHLAACGHKSAYPSLETAQENTVKRNMLDMLGLVKRDGEQGNEIDANDSNQPQEESGSVQTDLSVAAVDESNVTETLQPPPEPMDTDTATLADAAPIQFGQMDAAPQQHVAATTAAAAAGSQHYSHIVDNSSHLQTGHAHAQYHLGFGQAEVAGHTLNAADIDMPLIGELADPNPPPTPQFLGEVHTPMFDAVAAAEQQHYHQLMQQQHLQQHSHHHGAQ